MIFLFNVVLTMFMTGLIWFVQIVHYPLFNRVGSSVFNDYHKLHVIFTGRVVIIPMVLELVVAFLWLFDCLDTQYFYPAIMNVVLLFGIWSSTFFFQVPAHNRIAIQFNQSDYHILVKTNWIRTLLWSLKSLLLLYILQGMLG